MVGLPDVEESLRICLMFILFDTIQEHDRWMDSQADEQMAYAMSQGHMPHYG